jgi:hypothetical protein
VKPVSRSKMVARDGLDWMPPGYPLYVNCVTVDGRGTGCGRVLPSAWWSPCSVIRWCEKGIMSFNEGCKAASLKFECLGSRNRGSDNTSMAFGFGFHNDASNEIVRIKSDGVKFKQ